MRRRLTTLTLVSGALLLAGCGSPVATTSTTPTPRPRPTPTPVPTSVPVAPGPYALLITNDNRAGVTYDVLLVNGSGTIVARVTAKLPLLKPNQTLTLSPVSAGATRAYYLDGDTDIHSLAADGTSALVKSIAAGTTAELAFAVSPDQQHVAVSAITEQSNDARSTGHGYIENLGDSGGHADFFTNTGYSAYRWPIAWFGNSIVDAIGAAGAESCQQGGYGLAGQTSAIPCAASIHVVDAATQNRVATICESPTTQPTNGSISYSLNGLEAAAGIACLYNQYSSDQSTQTSTSSCHIDAVGWTGSARRFDTCTTQQASNGGLSENTCFLSPDGSRMACTGAPSGSLSLLKPGTPLQSLGRKYTVLGWMDNSHLMVDVDSATMAVVNVDSGVATTFAVPSADHVTMQGVVGAA
ncbi:MAG: hypothetical protein M3R48_04570 [Candidatus Dormibacteraeota bacterium]|nr:hypothetical protein [Candidatus Dormibacteraeota bacterium]